MDYDVDAAMLEKVEHAWNQSHDLEDIHHLAAESPEHAGAIYEFVELLVTAEHSGSELTALRAQLDGRVRRYLEQSGFRLAASLSTAPSLQTASLVHNLTLASGLDVASIAAALEVSTSFVVGLQDQLERFPSRAREEITRRLQTALGLTPEAAAALLIPRSAKTAQRAARSRSGGGASPAILTFEQFVANVGLGPERVAYWLSLQTDD